MRLSGLDSNLAGCFSSTCMQFLAIQTLETLGSVKNILRDGWLPIPSSLGRCRLYSRVTNIQTFGLQHAARQRNLRGTCYSDHSRNTRHCKTLVHEESEGYFHPLVLDNVAQLLRPIFD